ncbi:hypothetical protein [Vibrio diabolicus]|uniref:hypothetical protein n=1 Tax=Vibrio diabolicus TaxID=50719 RepID=UPI001869B46B|nr:hypothetical protein [Vibrio parahaemolyticus]
MTRAYWSESATDGRICATYEITDYVKAEACLTASYPLTSKTQREGTSTSTTTKKVSSMKKSSKSLKKLGAVAGLSSALPGGSELQVQTNAF